MTNATAARTSLAVYLTETNHLDDAFRSSYALSLPAEGCGFGVRCGTLDAPAGTRAGLVDGDDVVVLPDGSRLSVWDAVMSAKASTAPKGFRLGYRDAV
jgi:hypothetical protein